jgi:hypothetical protein
MVGILIAIVIFVIIFVITYGIHSNMAPVEHAAKITDARMPSSITTVVTKEAT